MNPHGLYSPSTCSAQGVAGQRTHLTRTCKRRTSLTWCLILLAVRGAIGCEGAPVRRGGEADSTCITIPYLQTSHPVIDRAFRIAMGDLLGNVRPFQSGLLEKSAPVILAGLDYGRPWTRDASVNVWNGASFIMPGIARNTLVAVLQRDDGRVRIGGQYWDAMVWATGAWNHYLYTGDKAFLALALTAVTNSLRHFEQTEFDAESGLFRGPGWSDGVAAYPGIYGDAGGSSAILDWPKAHPEKISKPGYGIPMKALSSNCLYYHAYVVAAKMARELNKPVNPDWARKATALKAAMNQRLWLEDKGWYRFFIGPFGDCDYQEGLGHAYALLFGIARADQATAIFQNVHVTPAGLPCVWPTCPRYARADGRSFGRHSGPVWPQIQGFWAEAAARFGRTKVFEHELFNLAQHAVRDHQFAEMYHPLTGEIYGGLQEAGSRGIVLWNATSRQTWAATAFFRMVLFGLAGMRVQTNGIQFEPCLPQGITHLELSNLRYRRMQLEVVIRGPGRRIIAMKVNGQPAPDCFLSNTSRGQLNIAIQLGH